MQQTLRAIRRAACCPHTAESLCLSTSRTGRMLCAAVGKPTWRLPTTKGGFSTVVGTDVKPPTQPLPDPEVMKRVTSVLGPLDTKPLAPASRPVVIVISGPSGVGKDAVLTRLKEQREDLYFVVTATSRPKRAGEVEGRDYFFVSRERFEGWMAEGMLLEHALVYGEYKGIPRQQVDAALAAGTDVVLRIDVQGAATVKRLMPDCISIFVTADSEDVLVKRLVARKTEPLDKLLVRVQTARQENEHIAAFDYVVVNRDGELDECVRQVSGIIEAEKAKVTRRLQLRQEPLQPQEPAAAATATAAAQPVVAATVAAS
ncbi:hypothetical protein GPECTOR_145g736 [Gonium pectorale]|uniref:Guanylate kinase n=1 Tax=Gonium pectorale TaxID=33097 RepID=A0A150FZ08_GONPE|nr:hypothetical protein GPECTOR_145g736 [Gonium pectorale]|eukprot:KXZ42445.1 hypothetical protein GPECTOR_145g736 [Gonium pectorale]